VFRENVVSSETGGDGLSNDVELKWLGQFKEKKTGIAYRKGEGSREELGGF